MKGLAHDDYRLFGMKILKREYLAPCYYLRVLSRPLENSRRTPLVYSRFHRSQYARPTIRCRTQLIYHWKNTFSLFSLSQYKPAILFTRRLTRHVHAGVVVGTCESVDHDGQLRTG